MKCYPLRRCLKSDKHRRRGAYTVEFALCCSVFFLIVFTGIEFSRFMFARHSVDQAAYEGARVGILPGATSDQIRAAANKVLGATGVRNATITITPSVITEATETINVKISSRYSDNSYVGSVFLQNGVLESSVTLDHENKAYLVKERQPGLGNNDNEPQDY